MPSLPTMWLHYCHEQGCPPTVAAMARDMARPGDGVGAAMTCVWIASKFEEVYPVTQDMLCAHAGVARYDLRQQELVVLERTDWRLPIQTRVRRILHHLQVRDAFYDEAMYALLVAGMDGALPPRAWARVLRQVHTRVHPLLQLVATLTRFPRVRARVLRPRLSLRK